MHGYARGGQTASGNENILRVGMSFDDSQEWSEKSNNILYLSTIFHKGPLLAMSSNDTDLLIFDSKTSITITRYKKSLKRSIIFCIIEHFPDQSYQFELKSHRRQLATYNILIFIFFTRPWYFSI